MTARQSCKGLISSHLGVTPDRKLLANRGGRTTVAKGCKASFKAALGVMEVSRQRSYFRVMIRRPIDML